MIAECNFGGSRNSRKYFRELRNCFGAIQILVIFCIRNDALKHARGTSLCKAFGGIYNYKVFLEIFTQLPNLKTWM